MHIPKHFEVTDRAVIEDFITRNSFAAIVSVIDGTPVATHIPVELETGSSGKKVLQGHISKANPQWKFFNSGTPVLVIFLSGVNHYISSSWYGHANAPTCNYMSVHVTGKIKILQGEELWQSVRKLTCRHEKISRHPVSLDTLPPQVQKQISGIVGFEVSMDKVQAAFKLSQNRNEADYRNIVTGLKLLNTAAALLMAQQMEQQQNFLQDEHTN